MSIEQSRRERANRRRLVYPGTDVWKNKHGITEQGELSEAEASLFASRSMRRPRLRKFTLSEMCAIHKHIFGELYEWAGKLRSFTTSRGHDTFARPEFIESYFKSAVTQPLEQENYLIGTTRGEFARRAAYFVTEVNATHPFTDCNGRLTRIFLQDLALKAGHEIDIQRIASRKEVWYGVMRDAFNGNARGLENEILSAMPQNPPCEI